MSTYDNQLVLFLCQPKQIIRKVLVHKASHVSDLNKLFSSKPKTYIFNGMILHNSMKLEVYGVKNHDHIVVLDESKEPNLSLEMLHWIDATRDQQEFNDRMFMSIDYSNQIEAARLKDLKMSRIELKRKVFFKVMKNSLNDSMPQIDTKDVKTNIPDSKLSISPLPQFWECSQQQNLKLFRGYSEPNYPLDLKIDVKE